jgi:membrane-associated phospholipid phosphatase
MILSSTFHRAMIRVLVLSLLWSPLVTSVSAQEAAKPAAPPAASTGVQVAADDDQPKPTRSFFPTLFRNMADDVKHMPRKNSLYWLAAGSGLALAVHPSDESINERLQGSSSAEKFFKAGKYIGSFPVLFGAAAGTYLVGRSRGSGRARHLGMDLMEATLLSEGITQAIKYSVRRERPLRDDGTRASGYAFPSGHSSATFAAATVLQQHLGWKAAVPTYAVASYVAISRLRDQRHFASDVAFGAAEGIIVGRSVTWHGRNFYASPLLLPKGAGVMVSVSPAGWKRLGS